jgi:predicted lipoprotein with Yx(FWY)xxD motif
MGAVLTMRRITLVTLILCSLLATSAMAARHDTVGVRTTAYGRILVDGGGYALYAFTKDGRGASRCYAACATAWPPFIVARRPRATHGARSRLIGTTRRSDGRLQTTYRGRPLYYYVGDRRPGQVLCQNVVEFGGRWLVLRAGGRLVR